MAVMAIDRTPSISESRPPLIQFSMVWLVYHKIDESAVIMAARGNLGHSARPLWVTCGRRLGKNFLTFCSIGRVRSRVRPVDAADVAAGPNALRGSGPNR